MHPSGTVAAGAQPARHPAARAGDRLRARGEGGSEGGCAGCAQPGAGAVSVAKAPPRFGRFEILQLLGRGGMAEVYKARIVEGTRAGQAIALKRLAPKLAPDSEAGDPVNREGRGPPALDDP